MEGLFGKRKMKWAGVRLGLNEQRAAHPQEDRAGLCVANRPRGKGASEARERKVGFLRWVRPELNPIRVGPQGLRRSVGSRWPLGPWAQTFFLAGGVGLVGRRGCSRPLGCSPNPSGGRRLPASQVLDGRRQRRWRVRAVGGDRDGGGSRAALGQGLADEAEARKVEGRELARARAVGVPPPVAGTPAVR